MELKLPYCEHQVRSLGQRCLNRALSTARVFVLVLGVKWRGAIGIGHKWKNLHMPVPVYHVSTEHIQARPDYPVQEGTH